ncbi:NAD(P)-dependent oxidoreductase [bacterium]|jgi:UDP-glucuronate decarboxylase|nr:NAD(P)-dependent oxidoreductase [bacterium]
MKNFSKLSVIKREVSAWSELDGETIFITGGTGFFGTSLLYSLLEAKQQHKLNIDITILTRNIATFKDNYPLLFESSFIHCLQGDVVDFTFPEKKFSKIFHLATTSASETYRGEDQLKKYKTLVGGTERVLQFAVKCNADKIIFTSSGVAYGELPDGMTLVRETYTGAPETTAPTSALAQGKRSAEFLIAYYADKYGFDYVIARCFSFIGPSLPLDLHYAIGNFVFDALFKNIIEIKGDGSPVRSYLDVNDLTIWMLRLMSRKCDHSLYNVGSDQSISILELAKKVRNIIAPNKELKICGDSAHTVGNFSRNFYVPNIDRARNEHGLDVWIGLDQAIRRTIRSLDC